MSKVEEQINRNLFYNILICRYGYRCLNVILPMDGQLNRNFLISVSVSFVDQLSLKPKVQKDISKPVRLLYRSEFLEPVSAYETGASQTIFAITKQCKSLKLRCPIGSKPEKLPNNILPMEMKGFSCSGLSSDGPVEFHYESKDTQMLRITSLHRKLTHLPWTGEIQVSESYEYVHEGPKQPESPSFSRIEFTKTVHSRRGNLDGLQVVPRILLVVPKSARTIQIRDEVGIIWNAQDRRSIDDENDVVGFQLRSPLLGGMSVYFDFYYTMDADDLIKPYKSQASPFKKLLQMPMFRQPLDIVVDNFKLTFVLAEDTADIEYELGTGKAVKVEQRSFRTYFSTRGEKEISFEFKKMTREDLEKGIAILFNYPFWGTLRKPAVAFSTLIFLIIGALFVNRLDLSLREGKKARKTQKTGNFGEQLKKLFEKRREIFMNYEDLISGNLNTRSSDLTLKCRLDEQLNLLQAGIFEKIKGNMSNFSDPQKCAMNSMTLKRLYDEQIGVCNKILREIDANYNNLSFSFSQSAGQSASSINMNISKSGSADLLSVRTNQNIEEFCKEAIKIDAQVTEYEAKFFISS